MLLVPPSLERLSTTLGGLGKSGHEEGGPLSMSHVMGQGVNFLGRLYTISTGTLSTASCVLT